MKLAVQRLFTKLPVTTHLKNPVKLPKCADCYPKGNKIVLTKPRNICLPVKWHFWKFKPNPVMKKTDEKPQQWKCNGKVMKILQGWK